ncbi:transcription antitermination factor NusB [bacterium]|nr:transcription antitermination factor NusB [candidate division CSSED10-310 bacterium]
MGVRRTGREAAVQFLFSQDFSGGGDEELFWHGMKASPAARTFARQLAEGVLGHRREIDAVITEMLEHWRFERLSMVDRNILRVAVYELHHCPETPYKVIINEAIEIAKKFGSEKSPGFINGILDKVVRPVAAEPGGMDCSNNPAGGDDS